MPPTPLHTPLSTSRSIRLLHLESERSFLGSRPGLEGTLSQVRLDDAPSYEALSYTWGSQTLDHAVKINGQEVAITRSLWEFLTRVRNKRRRRTVWVDALCISQTDLNEKSRQVQMIGDIFRHAKEVLVWLGPRSGGSESLFEGIDPLSMFPRDSDIPHYPTGKERHLAQTWLELLRREYWTRTWIIQEILLGRSLVVFCGPELMDWNTLVERFSNPRLQTLLQTYIFFHLGGSNAALQRDHDTERSTRIECEEALSRFRYLHRRRTELQGKSGLTANTLSGNIFSLVMDFRDTKCVDRRDKVYALLSLSTASSSIVPDYNKSPVQLFIMLLAAKSTFVGEEYVHLAQALGMYSLNSSYTILCFLSAEERPTSILSKQVLHHVLIKIRELYLASRRNEHEPYPPRGVLTQDKYSSISEKALVAEADWLLNDIERYLRWLDGKSGLHEAPVIWSSINRS